MTPMKTDLKQPCNDCPWRRKAMPGWVGTAMTPEDWVMAAHGEAHIECHVKHGSQCAGAAIYRANVLKTPRFEGALVLEPDRVNVFTTPKEFTEYHRKFGKTSAE